MFRLLSLLLLFVPSLLHGQEIRQWSIPDDAPVFELFPAGESIIAIEPRIRSTELPYPLHATSGVLNAWIPRDHGVLKKMQLLPLVSYMNEMFSGTSPSYTYDVAVLQDGTPLVAAAMAEMHWSCLGTQQGKTGPLRLLRLGPDSAEVLYEFHDAMNPRFLRTSDGTVWLAWEDVTLLEVDPDILDGRYAADIHVVRIANDLSLHDERVVGEGFTPRWTEGSDGDVYLLRREAPHSAASENNRLLLRRIDPPASADIVIDSGGAAVWPVVDCSILAGNSNDFHILAMRGDSLTYHYCDGSRTVRHSGPEPTRSYHENTLLPDRDGNAVVIWKPRLYEPVRWSAATAGRMFDQATDIAGTDSVYTFTAHAWQDGRMKLLYRSPRRPATILADRDVLDDATPPTPLFTVPGGEGTILEWLLTGSGDLWCTHQVSRRDTVLSSLYHVRDVTLGIPPPPAVPGEIAVHVAPHPLRDRGIITLQLTSISAPDLTLYDLLGRERLRIRERVLPPGAHALPIDVAGLSPGLYLLCGTAGREHIRKTLVVR